MSVTVTLKKVGDTVVVAIPEPLLIVLGVSAGGSVALAAEGRRVVIERTPPARPRYTLDELLAACEVQASLSEEDGRWLSGGSAGAELI